MAIRANMTPDDRQRFHELLDYALDNHEDYVLMRFAEMDLDFQLHIKEYRLHIRKYEDTGKNE